jgi:hypothetical protein
MRTPRLWLVGGGYEGLARVWRPADGTSVAHPLDLSERVASIALHSNIVVTAAGRTSLSTNYFLHDPYEIVASSAALSADTTIG